MNEGASEPATKAFLGIGWAFPPRLERDGSVAQASYEEDVRQAIRIILGTNPGERIMRPDFGAGLKSFVFEPVNTSTLALVKTRVEEALVDWEPRINVEAVKVQPDSFERDRILIEVSYRIRSSNALHNLVYPFYLREGASP